MKSDLGDLFAIFPDLPRGSRQPVEDRVEDIRARAGAVRRRMEENARARKQQAERVSAMWKRRIGRR
jgi:hypothetical protein